jgi:protein-S-isoprenylcysteine O-methyltransferase Ste14
MRNRWISTLHRVATGARVNRILLTPVGLVIFAAFTAAFVLLAMTVDRVFDLSPLLPSGAHWAVAIPVIVPGVAVTAWSAGHFLKARGTPVPFNPPPTLVTDGPYRFARNPMVTGVILILFGTGFAIRSVALVVIFTPLYLLVNVWELTQVEEPELVRRFGDTYQAYRRQTPMFLPRLRRTTTSEL